MRVFAIAVWVQVLFILCAASSGTEPDAQEIVRQSVEKNHKNWKVADQYAFTERDVVTEGSKVTTRVFKVLMIDGSQYNQLIEENGEPLPQTRAEAEAKKLKEEIARRDHETPSARNRRIAAYQRSREEEHALMNEMANAFNFEIVGRELVNGHNCFVLDATPRPGYHPSNNETKVLTGMRGKMWIDTRDYQWVKVEAEVFRPVALDLFIARVQPGTEFVLEQAPVDKDIWLPVRFTTTVRATALVLWSKNYTRDEMYSNYRLAVLPEARK